MRRVFSKHNIPVRLSDKRWIHIVENHDDLAGMANDVLETVANPDIIVRGESQELLAVRKQTKHWIVVVYKEQETDGFIITSFTTSRLQYILKKEIIWKKQS